MLSSIELIQIYRSGDLETLLCRAAKLFEQIGFPYVSFRWTPAPGATRTMLNNSSVVWDNFDDRLGIKGRLLSDALEQTMKTTLARQKADVIACQDWKLSQRVMFAMVSDAPEPFVLIDAERRVIADFSEAVWREFVAHPVCVERDRSLILIAKTHERLSDAMRQAADRVFDALMDAGLEVLRDAKDILPAEDWRGRLECF